MPTRISAGVGYQPYFYTYTYDIPIDFKSNNFSFTCLFAYLLLVHTISRERKDHHNYVPNY